MVHTLSRPRLTFFLALGIVAAGGLALASPAMAQGGRFRVLIPTLERQGDVKKSFAEDVAKEVQKLIDGMPTHAPVEKGDLKDMLKKYGLKEDALNCITARQLAAQTGVEIVMCGTVKQGAGGMEVAASFISAKDQQTFEVDPVTATDPKQAAAQIFSSFQSYVNVISLTGFGMGDLANEQWDAALEKFNEALAIDAKNPTALYGKGFALMKKEQFEPSLEALKAVLELNPVHQEALQAAGYVAAKMGQKEESSQYFRQYLELNPGNAQVRLSIAIDAATAGNPEIALEIVEQGLATAPDDLTLVVYAGYFATSAAAQHMDTTRGQNGGALQVTPEAAALYEKALAHFEKVFTARGDSVEVNVLAQMLNAYTQLGRTQEAVEFGARAVAAKPAEAQLWRGYAMALEDAGRVDGAIAALDSVLTRDPQASNIRALQGQWLVQAGRLDESVAAFRRAVENGEIDSDVAAKNIFVTGYNEKWQKKMQAEAMPYFAAALKLATQPQTQAMIHFWTGYGLYNRGMTVQEPSTVASARQALPIFQEALQHFRQAGPYAETQPSINLQQIIGAAQQYIEIQEALIKRGR